MVVLAVPVSPMNSTAPPCPTTRDSRCEYITVSDVGTTTRENSNGTGGAYAGTCDARARGRV